MENVYMVAIIVSILVFTLLICLCSMSGYTTKRKNPDDYMEINRKQREKGYSTGKSPRQI